MCVCVVQWGGLGEEKAAGLVLLTLPNLHEKLEVLFFFLATPCRILVPQPGTELVLSSESTEFSPLDHREFPRNLSHIKYVFLFFLIIFNWRIIVVQYCVGFYQTSTCISCRSTHAACHLNIPPPSHPSQPSLSPNLSSLNHTGNSHWLSISHTVMYISMLLSTYIPPFPFYRLQPCPQVSS